jgi:hypothetical protein
MALVYCPVVGVCLTNIIFQKFIILLTWSDRKHAASLDPLDGASRSYCTHLTDISFATESAGQDPFPQYLKTIFLKSFMLNVL